MYKSLNFTLQFERFFSLLDVVYTHFVCLLRTFDYKFVFLACWT